MSEPENAPEFSLLGGPLHRLGCRLGLVFRETHTFSFGLAIAGIAWGVLLALSLIKGTSKQLFSIDAIAGHVRLLAAIPLFFLCETGINPRMAAFVRLIRDSGIVPRIALPELDFEIARVLRLRDSWLPEGICFLASALLFLLSMRGPLPGYPRIMATPELYGVIGETMLTSQWYRIVCLPLYRFLLLRWLWHLMLWSYFLWRLSRMNLNLVPTHPDGAAGLGFLEVVHTEFIPLILAVSAVQSASFAESISAGAVPFEGIYPAATLSFALVMALFIGPLCIFCSKLRACRIRGRADYMRLGSRYVNAFEKKWLGSRSEPAPGEPLLGTPDIQSLSDLSNSFGIVKNMRLVPMSKRLVLKLAGATLLPLFPLLLIGYHINDLMRVLVKMVLGL